jgi:hypothetical protein
MRRENRRPEHRSGALTAAAAGARSRSRLLPLGVECLEGRQLLSIYMGPSKFRPLFSSSAFYKISLTGPGFQTVTQIGQGFHKIFAIHLTGTTSASQLNVTLESTRLGYGTANEVLQIGAIKVQSGLLGAINAVGTADLLGAITPLHGTVQTIGLNNLGPNAQINVLGSLGSFQASNANLSPNGAVHVTGGVTGQFSVGSVNLNGGKVLIDQDAAGGLSLGALSIHAGGQFIVGRDVTGASTLGTVDINGGLFKVGRDVTSSSPLSTSNFTIEKTGQFIVGNDLSGGLQVNGDEKIVNNGLFQVRNNLNGLTVGNLLVDSSGRFLVGHDANAPLEFSSITVQNSGQFNVAHNVKGTLNVRGGVKVLSNGQFQIGNDLDTLTVGQDLSLGSSGQLSIGEDITGSATINGNLALDSGGNIAIGRNVAMLTITGNLAFTPSAGAINIQGNLNGLTINGSYLGPGNTTTSNPELNVGLNLLNLTVLGGAAGQGAISNANIAVGKDLVGINIPHGIFNSLLTVGVTLDGAGPTSTSPGATSTAGTIGADGSDSVFDAQILAGTAIKDLTINGNVHSDYVTNPSPTGFRTRIIAGVNRQGTFSGGGLIDKFQITGALIDAVLAASVQPFGGNGTLPPSGYGANATPSGASGDDGFDTYDAPAGVIVGGTFANPISYPNYTQLSYKNEILTGVAYNTIIDPTIDDFIFPGGAINPSFASPPAAASVTTTIASGSSSQIGLNSSSAGQTTSTGSTSNTNSSLTSTVTTTTMNIAIPTKSTVLGGVISTSHGNTPDAFDFAGLFAADTSGVFIGQIPVPQPPSSS